MAERVYLTVGEVLQIHHQQIDNYGGAHGIRDKGLLESAVFRPQVGYYNNIAEEAAALMESLANNHPFLDGNKRVAFQTATYGHEHFRRLGRRQSSSPAIQHHSKAHPARQLSGRWSF